jgi:two-component system CheB/CheR fusion protein
VAVVDIGLPVLDGYEVARRVRSALGGRVVLIALTAYGCPEDVRRAFEAGFAHHLTKPAEPGDLLRLLRPA